MQPQTEWPIAFFDDDYLKLYAPVLTQEQTAREVSFIEASLDLPAGARVLDLACGIGRHAIGMAAHGYRVTGVDFSPRYLELAREGAARAGVGVEWQHGDMRTLSFERCFEAVYSYFTSFGYFDPHILRLADKYPKVRFAHCGGLWTEGKHPKNVGSYFGYIDECQYLNGVAAGHTSKTKKLGFIAAKPIPQVLRNINAFTLGARSVDPKITTQLIITGDWSLPVKEAEAAQSLIDQGVDVLTCHVDSPKVVVETAERRGVFVCGYHANQATLAPKGYLTGAEWNWLTPYTTHVKDAQAGAPMVNFLRGGLKEGFVKTSAYGRAVSEAGRKNADAVKARMMKGDFVIFKGPLKDNTGKTVIDAGIAQPQTDVVLEQMNYLVEGVIGKV